MQSFILDRLGLACGGALLRAGSAPLRQHN